MKTIYETECWGEVYRMQCDFSDAASPITVEDEDGDYVSTPWQAADFASPAAAMRAVLEQSLIDSHGDPDEEAIAVAVANMR